MTAHVVQHRFRCDCGKVNQFSIAYGPARKVTVRWGSCKQLCRMDVPESKPGIDPNIAKLFLDSLFGRR